MQTFHQFSIALVVAISFGMYIRSAVKDKIDLTASTWWIWGALNLTVFIGTWKKGQPSILVGMCSLGSFVVAALAQFFFRKSEWGQADYLCALGAVVGIFFLVALDQDPEIGMLFSLSVIFIGAYPLVKAVYRNPHRQDFWCWMMQLFSGVLTLAPLKFSDWTLVTAGAPVVYLLVQLTVITLILVRRRSVPESSLTGSNDELARS